MGLKFINQFSKKNWLHLLEILYWNLQLWWWAKHYFRHRNLKKWTRSQKWQHYSKYNREQSKEGVCKKQDGKVRRIKIHWTGFLDITKHFFKLIKDFNIHIQEGQWHWGRILEDICNSSETSELIKARFYSTQRTKNGFPKRCNFIERWTNINNGSYKTMKDCLKFT